MKFDFFTALVVMASSASAITLVKNDAELDDGIPRGLSESAMTAQSGTDADSEFFDSHYYTVSPYPG